MDIFMRLEKGLLPGIENQVTLENIASRVPWIDSADPIFSKPCMAASYSDRLTYEARFRANSRETFVVVNNIIRPGDVNGIALVPFRALSVYYQLRPIPYVGIPWGSQCATRDGKVYIFGGSENPNDICGRRDVYVLDLAGRKQWQQCAKMQEGRKDFGCGVKDGKIYLIGGCRKSDSHTGPDTGAEVYDPQENAWSAIKPMPPSNWNHPNILKMAAVGEELRVYPGKGTCSEYWAYNPVIDDWRTIVTNFRNTAKGVFFMAHGQLRSFRKMFGAPRVLEEFLAVDGEYLAIVNHKNGTRRLNLCGSRGLGMSISFRRVTFMCPIQL